MYPVQYRTRIKITKTEAKKVGNQKQQLVVSV